MAKYQQYAEYKDFGAEWLPTLPIQWKVERVKRMLSLRRSIVGDEFDKFQLLSLTLRGVIPRDISNGDGKIPESFNTYQQVHKDDLVFCLFDMDETPRTVGIAEQQGMITGAYNVYASLNCSYPKYLYYYFLHLDYFKGLKPFYTGLRKVVRADTFSNIEIPCPSIIEQTQIANFLDHETTKIDSLIEKQKQLIQLLKEKRQAVISHAVTKGLDPRVKMKDSGVEWLGEVPEHWRVAPLKYLIASKRGAVKAGPFGSHLKNSDMEGEDVKVISQKNVIANDLYIGEAMISKQKYRELEVFTIQQDDILVTTRGTIGRTCVFKEKFPAILHPCLIRLQVDFKKVIPELIALIIQESGYEMEQILVKSNATTIEVIYSDNLINTIVVIPSNLFEQAQILNYINEQKVYFDKILTKANQMIQKLKERRTALISAAVTGKIDVRDWQSPHIGLGTQLNEEFKKVGLVNAGFTLPERPIE